MPVYLITTCDWATLKQIEYLVNAENKKAAKDYIIKRSASSPAIYSSPELGVGEIEQIKNNYPYIKEVTVQES